MAKRKAKRACGCSTDLLEPARSIWCWVVEVRWYGKWEVYPYGVLTGERVEVHHSSKSAQARKRGLDGRLRPRVRRAVLTLEARRG